MSICECTLHFADRQKNPFDSRRIFLTGIFTFGRSFIHENWNKFTIEITIVYHVNGCRWLKRQCYKFAHWIRLWHIPNVTVTIKWQYYHHCNCYVLMDSQVLSHVSSILDLDWSRGLPGWFIFWYECLYYHSNVPVRIPEFGYLCKWW